jgi:hypothetical protein
MEITMITNIYIYIIKSKEVSTLFVILLKNRKLA